MVNKLQLTDGNYIAYHKINSKKNRPSILFLGGFMSDMNGTKATALQEYCENKGYGYIRFDYFGHGQSSGKFTEGTIGRWKNNVLTVLDELTDSPQIVIGSSMGGWLMLLAALERPEKILSLIGIASAPDFTEDLIWNIMTKEQKKELSDNGIYMLKSDYGDEAYPIRLNLIEEGRNHLLLKNNININIPVRLIHGMKDEDVPASFSTNLAMQLTSNDVKVKLIENGDHRMSTKENIELIFNTIEEIIKI